MTPASQAKQTVHAEVTPCGLQKHTRASTPCLAEQPGLQLAVAAVAHRGPGQDLLSGRTALPLAVGHQEGVLLEADGLRVHQAFLFVAGKDGGVEGGGRAGAVGGRCAVWGEVGPVEVICRAVTGTGLRVLVGEGFHWVP